ncbi:MAG: DNA polymerase I [bacterium]|nr:DNA polymerase I [bacterium]MDZ4285607.1 DNA polymerase I [Candidatus Sungbacteria bacterium]
MKKLVIIDSHAIIHRAYHALPPLTSPTGEPTNAVYGFTTILLKILRDLKPDYIVAASDLPGATFRHLASERYKATRPETPNDLASQFAGVKKIVAAFDIPLFEQEGYEADDIVGTIVSKVANEKDVESMIVTGDMDFVQLVNPRVKIYAMRKGVTDTVIYDEDMVRERYGFEPKQMIDFKALKGDTSDNIAGVRGIGEKTALTLIQTFGSVEEIYKQAKKGSKKISPSVAKKLIEGEEDAMLSKELATIHSSVPIEVKLEHLARKPEDLQKVREAFQTFGFFGLLKRLGEDQLAGRVKATPQSLLFASDAVPEKEKVEIATLSGVKDFLAFVESNDDKRFSYLEDGVDLFVMAEKNAHVARIASDLFTDKTVKRFFEEGHFISCDAKAALHFLHKAGIQARPADFDVMIASYLTGSFSRDFSYAAILGRELGRPADQEIRQDFAAIFEIEASLQKKLESENMKKVFFDMEMPMIRILFDMEEKGVMVDPVFLKKLANKIDGEIETLTASIYKQAGEEFNINSPRQLSHILFEVLNLQSYGLKKTAKGGVVSTGAAELEKLKNNHPIVENILLYRELAKLKGTYVDVLPTLIDSKDGRVHTTFNQTIASTGRLSSSSPNLQHIPISKTNPMSEYGREIRKAFIAPNNFLFCSFDYSQIELRVAAHLSNDPKMIEAFNKGFDIHSMTAAAVYHISLGEVTPDLRRAAKTLNFGILYGMGAMALAEGTGMTHTEAKKFIDDYFREFAGVRMYLDGTKHFAEMNGYVETLFGRRRYIPEIHSPNWQLKREAERMAINMPIQGTATGDIVKMAMIAVDKWIHKNKHEEDVRMILQVHDELVFEISESKAVKLIPEIKKIMENVADLKVPLVVDAKIGKNWGEQEKK